MNKNDQRVIKTDKQIRQALFQLMEVKDISQISVVELARTAKIDRKTFYAHYSNPMAVYEAIEAETAVKLEKLINVRNFDLTVFFKGLNSLLEESHQFYQAVAKRHISFIVEQSISLLTQKLDEHYHNHILNEFVAAGIVQSYVDWLRNIS